MTPMNSPWKGIMIPIIMDKDMHKTQRIRSQLDIGQLHRGEQPRGYMEQNQQGVKDGFHYCSR